MAVKVGKRRKSRELALQMLFQSDMGKQSEEQVRKTFWNERSNVDDSTRGFTDDLFRVACDRSKEIDDLNLAAPARQRGCLLPPPRGRSLWYGTPASTTTLT